MATFTIFIHPFSRALSGKRLVTVESSYSITEHERVETPQGMAVRMELSPTHPQLGRYIFVEAKGLDDVPPETPEEVLAYKLCEQYFSGYLEASPPSEGDVNSEALVTANTRIHWRKYVPEAREIIRALSRPPFAGENHKAK